MPRFTFVIQKLRVWGKYQTFRDLGITQKIYSGDCDLDMRKQHALQHLKRILFFSMLQFNGMVQKIAGEM